tara:strand:- start:2340 stop:3206 length:867 start_codon:yes stop_codon:yes gene_type:complete
MNVNVQNITSYNISSYIRKNDKHACVIDAMALVLDRETYVLTDTLRYMLEKYDVKHAQLDFECTNDPRKINKEIGMQCDDLLLFLSKIPGHDCKYRLYRYAESIVSYMSGNNTSIDHVLRSSDKEKLCIQHTLKRKLENDDYIGEIKRIRDFELCLAENTTFANYTPSEHFTERIKEITKKFYETKHTEITDYTQINELREEEMESFLYVQETSKIKKTEEITWSQVIRSQGYDDDFYKRMECARRGSIMKYKKGHVKVSKRGRESVFIYTDADLKEMKSIVNDVFSP